MPTWNSLLVCRLCRSLCATNFNECEHHKRPNVNTFFSFSFCRDSVNPAFRYFVGLVRTMELTQHTLTHTNYPSFLDDFLGSKTRNSMDLLFTRKQLAASKITKCSLNIAAQTNVAQMHAQRTPSERRQTLMIFYYCFRVVYPLLNVHSTEFTSLFTIRWFFVSGFMCTFSRRKRKKKPSKIISGYFERPKHSTHTISRLQNLFGCSSVSFLMLRSLYSFVRTKWIWIKMCKNDRKQKN